MNRDITCFCSASALDAIEHGGSSAVKIGFENTLPSVDYVICLNGRAVTPVCILDGDFKTEFFRFGIFSDFNFLSQSFFEFAIFIEFRQTFENESENLNRVFIRVGFCGVKIQDLCAHVNFEFSAFRSRVVFRDLCTTGNHTHTKSERQQDSQCLLHLFVPPKLDL